MLLAVALTAPLAAQLEDADAATQAKCTEYMKTPLPGEAAAVPQPKVWPECDSVKLYAGIGTKVNYEAARGCAWSERLAVDAGLEPRYSTASVFGGSAMLSVLYANGQGVARNIPLAARFACEAGGAPAEIAIRIRHLESLGAGSPATGSTFDFCDDITSGFMEGFCAAYGSEIGDQKRATSLDALASRFTPVQRSAFEALHKSEEEYADAHARGEIDLSGTARAMFQIDAEQSLRDDFLAALQSFEKGDLPKGITNDAHEADQSAQCRIWQSHAGRRNSQSGLWGGSAGGNSQCRARMVEISRRLARICEIALPGCGLGLMARAADNRPNLSSRRLIL